MSDRATSSIATWCRATASTALSLFARTHGNRVTNNRVGANGFNGAVRGDGIRVFGFRNLIAGNQVFDNALDGISVGRRGIAPAGSLPAPNGRTTASSTTSPAATAASDVDAGIVAARRHPGSLVHEPAIADLLGVARTFLLAMAHDHGPSRMSDIAARLNVDSNYASQYRLRLIATELIEPAGHGRVVHHAVPA